MPDFHIFNTSGNNPDNNNSELLNNQKTSDSSILSGARDVTDEELKRQNTEDSMNVSEVNPQKDDSDFYRIVREHLMRWSEEKERKAKEQEAKKREEESKKEEQSDSKPLGSIGSIIKKVRAEMEIKKLSKIS